jgi:3-polyprenyl-4-hydroxybenzoate decarboxylase
MAKLRRAAIVRIFESAHELCIVQGDGRVVRISGESAELARALLDHLCEPRTREEVYEHISALSGSDATKSPAVGQALDALCAAGVVTDSPLEVVEARQGPRVVIALSGGVAAAFAPALAELLLARGCELRFAATESALRFVTPLALSALSHQRVVTSLWPESDQEPVPHLALASWAELVIVYPATATTLARIAGGDCSSVVSALAISARVPVLLVPAMNENMLRAPSVQRNLALLRDDGFVITHCSLGYEVAQAPAARRPVLGGAPPFQAVVDVAGALLGR